MSTQFMPAAQKPPAARLRPSPLKCYIQAMKLLASTALCLVAFVRPACTQPDLVSKSHQGNELMAAGGGTYFDVMRRAFHAKAEALGYEVIDLDSNFFARHARTGERFEFPHDGHWNAAGHEVAFEAVMASRLIKALVR